MEAESQATTDFDLNGEGGNRIAARTIVYQCIQLYTKWKLHTFCSFSVYLFKLVFIFWIFLDLTAGIEQLYEGFEDFQKVDQSSHFENHAYV